MAQLQLLSLPPAAAPAAVAGRGFAIRSSAVSPDRYLCSRTAAPFFPSLSSTALARGTEAIFFSRRGAGDSDFISDLELATPGDKQPQRKRVNGIFWILLINLGLYLADHLFKIRQISALYLFHARPAWYQFVTSTFCHANWNHLSSNLFFVYIFGKLVEEEEGNFALWFSYILTGAGANLISWLILPRSAVSIGASGAVFGLFTISVLVKMSWDWRKIIEVLILGQFVIDKVLEAAQASRGFAYAGYSLQVNHIAHLSGALIGALLVLMVSQIPSPDSRENPKSLEVRK